MKVLIVEDEQALAKGLKFNFEQEGYEVVLAADGQTALDYFQNSPPVHVIVLDLMLPGMSGYETCRRIRELDNRVPILVLSARTLPEDKALAFDCGTDQYVTKPFALPELLSRVRHLIERHPVDSESAAAPKPPPELNEFEFEDVHIDFRKFELNVRGEKLSLTTREVELLRFFVTHENEVVSRAEIQEAVWDDPAELTTRSIDNFVLRLRRYIELNPAEPRHFVSIRGTGYRFIAHPADDVTPA